jgi:SAM-dependent methyltransferase
MQSNWNEDRAKNWNLFMPPARPSNGEMTEYEKVISRENYDNQTSWVLLGATPEVRSLAANYNQKLICIDKNENVFEILRSLVRLQNPFESFICSNWLEADLSKPIDLLIGDGAINMLPIDFHEKLLKKIYHILKPQGLALLRVHIKSPPRFSDPQEVFRWHRNNNSDEHVFSATRTDLDMLWLEPKNLKINFENYHKKIQQLYAHKLITSEEFKAYDKLLRYNKINLYYAEKEIFESIASKYFDIENITYGNDYSGYKNHPIYILRKSL